MEYKTLITATDLNGILEDPQVVIMDCRYYLPEPERGYQEYLEGHIPGANYIHLDRDLAGEIIPGQTGRHPLPDSKTFTQRLSKWGVDNSTQVIAYDNMGGAFAARLWWMLRWLDHEKVAVLDGGWNAWVKNQYPQQIEIPERKESTFTPKEHPDMIADVDFVDQIRLDPDYLLIDARSAERYWGLKEDVDFKAGHIPGAVTAPYLENLTEDEYFLPVEELKERYQNLIGDLPVENVVFYCGSGVTSIHSMISMVLAGYDLPRLYPGSWSEWSLDSSRPIAP